MDDFSKCPYGDCQCDPIYPPIQNIKTPRALTTVITKQCAYSYDEVNDMLVSSCHSIKSRYILKSIAFDFGARLYQCHGEYDSTEYFKEQLVRNVRTTRI